MLFEIWIIPAVLSPGPRSSATDGVGVAADPPSLPSAPVHGPAPAARPDGSHAVAQAELASIVCRQPSAWPFPAGTHRDASGTLGDASGVSTGGAYSVILPFGWLNGFDPWGLRKGLMGSSASRATSMGIAHCGVGGHGDGGYEEMAVATATRRRVWTLSAREEDPSRTDARSLHRSPRASSLTFSRHFDVLTALSAPTDGFSRGPIRFP